MSEYKIICFYLIVNSNIQKQNNLVYNQIFCYNLLNFVYNTYMVINGRDIYQRIVDMFELRNINKNEFYKKLGISRQHLAKWKAGSLPSVEILYAIKEELHVSLDWLLTGINNQDATDPAAPYKIVNRIDNYIEEKTGHKVWEENIDFYSSIKHIVHKQELSDWLYGRQQIDISKVVKIADILGESVQYFITGSYISSAEYTEKYSGQKESEEAEFYKEYSCLNPDNKETIKHMTNLLFHEQLEKK